jgi:perosamine synthetase
MRIPLAQPELLDSDIEAVVRVLRTPNLAMGPALAEFEQATAAYVGAPFAVAVNSGTSALHLAVRCLNLQEGDEVILPSFAFAAVTNVLLQERLIPVFVEIDPRTLNITPASIESAIGPRTRAVLVVHTFGYPAEIDAIREITHQHKLALIEDACEAFGAEVHGKKVGTFGDAAVFAFDQHGRVRMIAVPHDAEQRQNHGQHNALFDAKVSVELHIYGHGGHGNGIKPRGGIPTTGSPLRRTWPMRLWPSARPAPIGLPGT